MTSSALEYDLLGIGFGPSNLALAIAMEERASAAAAARTARPLRYAFLERKPDFVWHGGMLLDDTDMQISFLKDLATLRNPRSPYTFINYLHSRGRLEAFINLKTFFPSRIEFNDYLAWVASHFGERCHYGEEVVDVLPEPADGVVQRLRVRSRSADGRIHERLTRNLVLGVGGEPQVPAAFRGWRDARVVHSSAYLDRIAQYRDDTAPRRIAVVGGGQSAAEVFMDLVKRYPSSEVAMVMRGGALKPSDDSPFVNEIFSPGFTDFIYRQPGERRQQMLKEYRNTNYSVVDLDLIERIYQLLYQQKVVGKPQHQLLTCKEIESASALPEGVVCVLRDRATGAVQRQPFDLVVLATGYRRQAHERMLAPLASLIGEGFRVDRHYRLQTSPRCLPQIFLQGCCEDSHGLSDTLLSVLAVRSHEIADAVLEQAMQTIREPVPVAPEPIESRPLVGTA
ncbi:SidA/IucD/PvdA family monooxygenase [Cupriavidus gilardii]|uniref:lysine N(6)-hydroxylase/L-ornithine N(5)-oxygenase family protein n=1 Tax=Cupriavidus gilardii TaxID=82541 RepID=UPI001ABE1445|nr:lysine N(6)-hydroxylase/L-ornithine N(5)-oxygenase family protein [Cupriavidus gilardii]MBO4122676.1 SidA/IucD/PvdA family monooxygenase [Cupriavidus gilardii]